MPPPLTVRPVQLPGESKSHCLPIRHEGPVLTVGTRLEVQVEGVWRPAVMTASAYSTVIVAWVDEG